MFNPYIPGIRPELQPLPPAGPPPGPGSGPLDGVLERLSHLERDDILIGLLVYLLAKDQEGDNLWPLLAAALYLFL